MPATNFELRSRDFSSPGWRRMRWRKASRVSSGSSASGPISGQPGNRVQGVRWDEIQLAQHLAIDVSQLAAIGEAQAQPRPGAHLGLAVVQQPEASGQHRVDGQHALRRAVAVEWQEQELAPPAGGTQCGAFQGGQRLRRGAHQDWSRSGGLTHRATGRASRQLLGHDRQVGKLRHAGGPLTVWYAAAAL